MKKGNYKFSEHLPPSRVFPLEGRSCVPQNITVKMIDDSIL